MAVFNDLSGNRYDMLYVVCRVENSYNGYVQYLCQCDCGNSKIVKACNLTNGNTHSCGCLKKKMMSAKMFKHGDAGSQNSKSTRLYEIWKAMIGRCCCDGSSAYDNYGGRGITVCDEWRNDYTTFKKWALSNGYQDNLTIDRINNNGNYSPDNCRWITMSEQMYNKRNNRLLTFKNETKTITEWANEYGINRRLLGTRIDRYHWSIEKALTTPVRPFHKSGVAS